MRDNLAYRETVAFAAKAIIGVSVIVGSGAIVLWSGEAYPHGWFTGTNDPVSGISCCGGTDCKDIDDTDVRQVEGGYVYLPTGEFIPRARIQQSQSYGFARCEFLGDVIFNGVTHKKGTTRCFFEPGGF